VNITEDAFLLEVWPDVADAGLISSLLPRTIGKAFESFYSS
jgi:hypothetical protein